MNENFSLMRPGGGKRYNIATLSYTNLWNGKYYSKWAVLIDITLIYITLTIMRLFHQWDD